MAGGNSKKKRMPPPTPPRGAARPGRGVTIEAVAGPAPFAGLRRVTRRTSAAPCPSGVDSQEFREMIELVREDIDKHKESSTARKKAKAAGSPSGNPAPAASRSATSGDNPKEDSLPADSSNPAVQPSLHKLQQQHDLKKAELDRKRAELEKMEEQYLASKKELARQARGGLAADTPGAITGGATAAAAGTSTGAPGAGAPEASPATCLEPLPRPDPAGKVPESIALRATPPKPRSAASVS